MDGTKQTTNWIIAGLVALVVIIGGGWLIARERSGTMAGTNATSTETTSTGVVASEIGNTSTTKPSKASTVVSNPTTAASGETISVSDQPAGASVMVADVSVSKPTWVAVRDSRPWYLGWKLVKNSQSNITVPLQRDTVKGQSYEVVLFADNGDGTFAIHGADTLIVN